MLLPREYYPKYIPKIHTQWEDGNNGYLYELQTCAAQAIATAKEVLDYKSFGVRQAYSYMWIYGNRRGYPQIKNNEGLYSEYTLDMLSRDGVPFYSSLPKCWVYIKENERYLNADNPIPNVSAKDSVDTNYSRLIKEARKNRIKSWRSLRINDSTAIKNAVYENGCCLMRIVCSESIFNTTSDGIVYDNTSQNSIPIVNNVPYQRELKIEKPNNQFLKNKFYMGGADDPLTETKNTFKSNVPSNPKFKNKSGHLMVILGWKIINGKLHWIVQNGWNYFWNFYHNNSDPDYIWGDNGLCYIPFDYSWTTNIYELVNDNCDRLPLPLPNIELVNLGHQVRYTVQNMESDIARITGVYYELREEKTGAVVSSETIPYLWKSNHEWSKTLISDTSYVLTMSFIDSDGERGSCAEKKFKTDSIKIYDLGITSITSTSVEPFTVGDTIRFNVEIKNSYWDKSPAYKVSVYDVSGQKLSSVSESSLPSVKTKSNSKTSYLDVNLSKPGTHKFKFVIEVDGDLIDNNSRNNVMTKSYLWGGKPLPPTSVHHSISGNVVTISFVEGKDSTNTEITWQNENDVNEIGSKILGKGITTVSIPLKYGQSYSYGLRAQNQSGKSKWVFGKVNIPLPKPLPPTSVHHSVSGNVVTILFVEGKYSTNTEITWQNENDINEIGSKTLGKGITTVSIPLKYGQSYSYGLRAENQSGKSKWVFGKVNIPLPKPLPPTSVHHSISGNVVTISFVEGKYSTITRVICFSKHEKIVTKGINSVSFTLEYGKTYKYILRAENNHGESDWIKNSFTIPQKTYNLNIKSITPKSSPPFTTGEFVEFEVYVTNDGPQISPKYNVVASNVNIVAEKFPSSDNEVLNGKVIDREPQINAFDTANLFVKINKAGKHELKFAIEIDGRKVKTEAITYEWAENPKCNLGIETVISSELEPFKVGIPTEFKVLVKNYDSTIGPKYRINVYENNNKIKSSTIQQGLQRNSSEFTTLIIGYGENGHHTLSFEINTEDDNYVNSNTSNNKVSKVYQWGDGYNPPTGDILFTKEYAQQLLREATTFETFNANISNYKQRPKIPVFVKVWGNSHMRDATLTLWQTCSQVCSDGSGDIQSGTHKPGTSMHKDINAEDIPYVVLPWPNTNNVNMGDLGVVIDTETNRQTYVIYAERGPEKRLGEMSIATFKNLGIKYLDDPNKPHDKNTNPLSGYDPLRFITIMFPGSGLKFGYRKTNNLPNSIPKSYSEMKENAEKWIENFRTKYAHQGPNPTKDTIIQNILDKAQTMIDYKWTPRENLVGWKNRRVFTAGTEVQGIPYSQTHHSDYFQSDVMKFEYAHLNKNDFYENDTMPQYGNDCSGFVSFAWGTERLSTHVMLPNIEGFEQKQYLRNFTLEDVDKGKESLQAGDAFVIHQKNGSQHTFLYSGENTSAGEYICYEQYARYNEDTKNGCRCEIRNRTRESLNGYQIVRLKYLDSDSNSTSSVKPGKNGPIYQKPPNWNQIIFEKSHIINK